MTDPAATWTPVVYGRTRTADRWWRAVPDVEASPGQLWFESAIHAVVASGRGLEGHPRFLLAQKAPHRLVGVACRAADISATMNAHSGRPLFCFVGWFGPVTPGSSGPLLDGLREHYREWAAALYQRWVGEDWDKHISQLPGPHRPPAGPAPWAAERPELDASPRRPRPTPPGTVLALPEADADQMWLHLLLRAPDAVLTVGWRTLADATLDHSTHVAANDVERPREVQLKRPSSDRSAKKIPDGGPAQGTPAEPESEMFRAPADQFGRGVRDRLRKSFPAACNFLLGDADDETRADDPPIPTLPEPDLSTAFKAARADRSARAEHAAQNPPAQTDPTSEPADGIPSIAPERESDKER